MIFKIITILAKIGRNAQRLTLMAKFDINKEHDFFFWDWLDSLEMS